MAEAEPCCCRNAVALSTSHSTQIEHKGRKAACLQQQVRRTQGLIEPCPWPFPLRGSCSHLNIPAAHPQQLSKGHIVGCGGLGIEGVVHIDPGADLAFRRASCQKSQCQARPPRRLRAGDLADGANRQATLQQLIHWRDSCPGNLADRPWRRRQRGRKTVGERALDFKAKDGGGGHNRDPSIFAICSLLDSL